MDSACIAGLLDLLRTAGMWTASARYGYVFGGLAAFGNLMLLDAAMLCPPKALAELLESAWVTLLREHDATTAARDKRDHCLDSDALRSKMRKAAIHTLLEHHAQIALPPRPKTRETGCDPHDVLSAIACFSVDAFFDNSLFEASRLLLAGAVGSFGLAISHSLDCDREMVIAARGPSVRQASCLQLLEAIASGDVLCPPHACPHRLPLLLAKPSPATAPAGQPMSVSFFPRLGMACWGSEAAATKAGMGVQPPSSRRGHSAIVPAAVNGAASSLLECGQAKRGEERERSVRFDLDDVMGEVLMLRWGQSRCAGSHRIEPPLAAEFFTDAPHAAVKVFLITDKPSANSRKPLQQRLLQLAGNPLISPLPRDKPKDPVGDDIADIPNVLQRIQDDWNNRACATCSALLPLGRVCMHATQRQTEGP